MKKMVVKQEMICKYGTIIALLWKEFATKSHEHMDFRIACSHLSDLTQDKVVNIVTENSEILKAIKDLKSDIQEITRAQHKLTKESKTWRDELTIMVVLLTEKVTGKTFGADIIAGVMQSAASKKVVENLSSSDNDEKKSEEEKQPKIEEKRESEDEEEEKVDEEIEAQLEESNKEAGANNSDTSSAETDQDDSDSETEA
ncbi:hypothetical protein COLO4_21451 [Corchorus olitorius]|uniref:Uncharacterized protein n=1 Tax=Corchorus olitorius TaxID=93759 RepID=A0A1R3IT92_9ROSI|nr:hypothetical protein COLO4_21451 [Corchorus olitorius]